MLSSPGCPRDGLEQEFPCTQGCPNRDLLPRARAGGVGRGSPMCAVGCRGEPQAKAAPPTPTLPMGSGRQPPSRPHCERRAGRILAPGAKGCCVPPAARRDLRAALAASPWQHIHWESRAGAVASASCFPHPARFFPSRACHAAEPPPTPQEVTPNAQGWDDTQHPAP